MIFPSKTSMWLEVLIKIVLCTLANFSAAWICLALHWIPIFFSGLAPLVLILLPWKPRVLPDLFALTVALVICWAYFIQFYPLEDWALLIVMGFLPIYLIQVGMCVTAPWVRRKMGDL